MNLEEPAPASAPETAQGAIVRLRTQAPNPGLLANPAKPTRSVADSDLNVAWREGWSLGFPGSVATPLDFKVKAPRVPGEAPQASPRTVLLALKSRLAQSSPDLPFFDFLTWCCANWAQVMKAKFHWMRNGTPAMPEARFLAYHKFTRHFVEAYSDRRSIDHVQALPGDEGEIARLMMGGMTQQQAMMETIRRQVVAQERDSLEADRRRLAETQRAVELERERLAQSAIPVPHRSGRTMTNGAYRPRSALLTGAYEGGENATHMQETN